MSDDWQPLVIGVAPNGARKTKADHPKIPITAGELAETAATCREAGASFIHLHVRDREGRHLLDAEAYRGAIAAVKAAVGNSMVVQITSEAAGIYKAPEQIAVVRAVRPEAVSLAPRELCADAAAEKPFAELLAWAAREKILVQYILYSEEEILRFAALQRRGLVPDGRHFVLFVLGRYTKDQRSDPNDLLPFVAANADGHAWSLCAFGPKETACALTAAALGGHARVGFENNLYLPGGSVAADNAALVRAVAGGAAAIGRPVASADEARAVMGAGG